MNEGRPVYLTLTAALLLTLLFALVQLPTTTQAAQPEPVQQRQVRTKPRLQEPLVPAEPEWKAPPADWQEADNMDGGHIFVYDWEKAEMLYCSTDPRDSLYPASITKLFSAWVALQYLPPEQEIQAGRELGLLQPGSSTAYIAYGSVLTAQMLVEGMLLPSGNDAAYVLAAAAGRAISGEELTAARAVEVFVEEMNRQADSLGLTGSHFENPDGYHAEGHYSCPADLAVIGCLALENEIIARYARCRSDSVRFVSGERCTWRNTNRLLNPESEYYCPAALGLKTGYTSQAGYCLLAAFDTEEKVLVGIFGAEDKTSRYENAVKLMAIASGI